MPSTRPSARGAISSEVSQKVSSPRRSASSFTTVDCTVDHDPTIAVDLELMSDPVTVSVLTHRLEAIVQEMGEAMLRTAYSQILNSSRDFSTALCDSGARLIAQAEHVPIHV